MKFFKAEFSTILVAILFLLFGSIGVSAQVKHGDLSLLKGKTKVFILPLPDIETKEMVDAIKQYSALTIVTKKEDADFIISMSTQDLWTSNDRSIESGNVFPYKYLTARIFRSP